MIQSAVFQDFIRDFSPSILKRVIRGLIQNPFVWEALQDPDFRNEAMQNLGTDEGKWTPMNLWILQNKILVEIEILRSDDLNAVDTEIRNKSFYELKTLHEEPGKEITLEQAGYCALALREHYLNKGNWEDLLIYYRVSEDNESMDIEKWTLIFQMAFEILPFPEEFIQALIVQRFDTQILLDIISTRKPTSSHDEFSLQDFISENITTEGILLLNALYKRNPQQAKEIASHLLDEDPANLKPSEHINNLSLQPGRIQTKMLMDKLRLYSGEIPHSKQPFGDTFSQIDNLKNEYFVSTIIDLIKSKRFADLSEILRQQPLDEVTVDAYSLAAVAFSESDETGTARSILKEISSHETIQANAASYLAEAILNLTSKQFTDARISLVNSIDTFHENPDSFLSHQMVFLFGETISELLIKLGLFQDGLTFINHALDAGVYSTNLLLFKAQSLRSLAKSDSNRSLIEKALSLSFEASISSPTDIAPMQIRTSIYEKLGDCEKAFINQEEIFANTETPTLDDYIQLALIALKNNNQDLAMSLCKSALENNPKNGLVHVVYGDIFDRLDEPHKAFENYEMAAQVSPNEPQSWIALSNWYQAMNDQNQALSTLLSGIQSIPNSPDLHFFLGEIYQSQKSHTQALNSYKSAFQLIDTNTGYYADPLYIDTAIRYGGALVKLGHYFEAEEILYLAYRSVPTHPELSYLYGKVKLNQGSPELAIKPLGYGAEILTNDPNAQFNYAETLIILNQDLEKAVHSLDLAHELDPENFEVKVAKADALAKIGKSSQAYTLYQELLKTPTGKNQPWAELFRERFGKLCVDINENETAIAYLKDYASSYPDNVEIGKILTKAFVQSSLIDDALENAERMIVDNPNNADLLIWYAELAASIGQSDTALNAVAQASAISPMRPDIWVILGNMQLDAELDQEAEGSFAKVIDISNGNAKAYQEAARGLLSIDKNDKACAALVKAINSDGFGELTKSARYDIFVLLIDLLQQENKIEDALQYVDLAAGSYPDSLELVIRKINLTHEMGNSTAAYDFLEKAYKQYPDELVFLNINAKLHRSDGELEKAFTYAQRLSQALPHNHAARALASEIALSCNQEDIARNIIFQPVPSIDTEELHLLPSLTLNDVGHLEFHCIRAELALDSDDLVQAAEGITNALILDSEHPRVLAAQARILEKRGDIRKANDTLETAITNLGTNQRQGGISESDDYRLMEVQQHSYKSSDYLAVGISALQQNHWATAVYILQEARKLAPKEPLVHLILSKAIVIKAEAERLSKELNVKNNSPGNASLESFAYQTFKDAINESTVLLEKNCTGEPFTQNDLYATWLWRGEAAFHPNEENIEHLKPSIIESDEIAAAYFGAIRAFYKSDIASEKTMEYLSERDFNLPKSPTLLSHIALNVASDSVETALRAAKFAAQEREGSDSTNSPLYKALYSFISASNEDYSMAIGLINDALETWNNEPYWHEFMARLSLTSLEYNEYLWPIARSVKPNDIGQALEHQSLALKYLAGSIKHKLNLAELYILNNDFQSARKLIDEVIDNHPHTHRALMLASGISTQLKEIDNAIDYATKAVTSNPEEISSLVLLSRLLLENGNPDTALDYIDHALSIKPENMHALQIKIRIYQAKNSPHDALALLNSSISINPESLDLQLERINILKEINGTNIALEEMTELSKKYPEIAEIQIVLAEFLAESGTASKAIDSAQSILDNDQFDLLPIQRVNLHNLLGNLLRDSGQLEQSTEHFYNAIEVGANDVDAYMQLGKVLMDRQEFIKAIETFLQASQINPDDPKPLIEAAIAYKEQKNYIKAEQLLQMAKERAPNDITVHRQLGALVALNFVHNRGQEPSHSF